MTEGVRGFCLNVDVGCFRFIIQYYEYTVGCHSGPAQWLPIPRSPSTKMHEGGTDGHHVVVLLPMFQGQMSEQAWRQPFRPESEIPSINARCAKKKTNKMGIVTIVLTAIR